jgi:hypothetical protein
MRPTTPACVAIEVRRRGGSPDVAIVLEGPTADDTPGFSADESPTAASPRLAALALQTRAARRFRIK